MTEHIEPFLPDLSRPVQQQVETTADLAILPEGTTIAARVIDDETGRTYTWVRIIEQVKDVRWLEYPMVEGETKMARDSELILPVVVTWSPRWGQ